MRVCVALLTIATGLLGESHPSWWTLAPPDATAIVGIQWQSIKATPFGPAVAAELGTSIGIPDLPCLTDARQILIASPGMIAIFNGSFNSDTLRSQAAALRMQAASYHGIRLWIASAKGTLSLAQLSDQMLLAGTRASLEAAIDRSQSDRRRYSPLLSRGARYSQAELFVIADRLPDPLASIFVPIEFETRAFEGYVSFANGLAVEASFDAGNDDKAAVVAESIRQSVPSLPPVAQTLEVKVDKRDVLLSLELDSEALMATLRVPPVPGQVPPPVAAAQAERAAHAEPKRAETPKPDPPKPAGPQVIRIFGLDGGPKEIVLPGGKPEKQ